MSLPIILDPRTGHPAQPADPNFHDVPCECGFINRVECKPPRIQNLPATSLIVLEHCEPFICAGCLRGVALCAYAVQTIVLKCLPVKPNEQPVPVNKSADPQCICTDPAGLTGQRDEACPVHASSSADDNLIM